MSTDIWRLLCPRLAYRYPPRAAVSGWIADPALRLRLKFETSNIFHEIYVNFCGARERLTGAWVLAAVPFRF
jgi:hypothetical protein